ncbi:putative protein ykoA [Bacillus velezensis NAU-B3]|nr:putative protein ykoA [Bacillus velezensis NAU-B3]
MFPCEYTGLKRCRRQTRSAVIHIDIYTYSSRRNKLKLLTLTEYCLMIFFTGVFLAVTGFTARDIGLYVGIALIYTFSHLFSKRMLEKRGKEKKQVNLFFSVLAIVGSVLATVLFIAVAASFAK